MILDEFLDLLEGVRPAGNGYVAICPAHDDSNPSLGVTGDDDSIAIRCHTGCRSEDVLSALGLGWDALFTEPLETTSREPEAVYDYTDESGTVLFQAVRLPGKRFRQRHHDPSNPDAGQDGWVWNLDGTRRVLYRLPAILDAVDRGETVYVTEGEKDADALVNAGKQATCNPMGAGKWRDSYSESLAGANVIIVQDRDEPGRSHAGQVRASLQEHGCRVWIVQAKVGKDAHDHLEAGHRPEEMPLVRERTHRGIVTAREMSERALLHLDATKDTEPEYIIQGLSLRLRNGRLYTLGGYTGDGKTNTALQIAREVCSVGDRKVGFFTLEMTEEDLRNRLICHKGLPLFRVERPWEMEDDQRSVYKEAVAEIAEWPLEIVYETGLTAERLCEVTREREYDFVILDHVHRFSWGHERRKLEEQVQHLTNLALEFNVPVFVLAQLRRYERGKGFQHYPEPTLQDFRDTEMLGAESSMALAIWRVRDMMGKVDLGGMSWLITLKDRYGQTGAIPVRFDSSTMTFVQGGAEYGNEYATDSGSGDGVGDGFPY